MTEEYWLVAAFGLAIALALGFVLGRRSAPTQHEVVNAQKERDEACAEVDRVRGEVTRHFEESATMFGRLADDYRTFFEQFAQTAQNLGVSEGRTRELLRQADPRLVADQSTAGTTTESADTASATEPETGGDESEAMGFEAAAPQSVGGEETLAEEEAPAVGVETIEKGEEDEEKRSS